MKRMSGGREGEGIRRLQKKIRMVRTEYTHGCRGGVCGYGIFFQFLVPVGVNNHWWISGSPISPRNVNACVYALRGKTGVRASVAPAGAV